MRALQHICSNITRVANGSGQETQQAKKQAKKHNKQSGAAAEKCSESTFDWT
jgi:hypothetical protein